MTNANYFFIALVSVGIILAILIFLPFLSPLILAIALAVVFTPIHRRVLRMFFKSNEKSSLGALVTLVAVAIVVFVPLALIAFKVYAEIQNIYAYLLDEGGRAQVVSALNGSAQSISRFFGIYPAYSFDSFNIVLLLQEFAQWIFGHLNTIFASASKFAISFFIMCLAFFYFLRDGRELKRQLISMSPLGDMDDEHIFSKLEVAIRSIFAGSIAVGVIQGILTGIGFGIFGVPSPALWGAIAAFAALIPGIGTSIVLIPGIAFLFFTGMTGHAIGLLIWSVVAVGLVDNFLGPIFVNRGIHIHPFLILLSVFGGIVFFGPIGFVLGPLVIAFLFSLLEIHKTGGKKEAKSAV